MSSSKYPFQKELELSVSKALVSSIAQNAPDLVRSKSILEQLRGLTNELIEASGQYYYSRNEGLPPLIYTEQGWIPLDCSLISRGKPKSIMLELVDPERTSGAWTIDELFKIDRWYLPKFGSMTTKSSIQGFLASILPNGYRPNEFFELFGEDTLGIRLVIKNETREEMSKPGKIPKYQWKTLEETFNNSSWSILETTGCPSIDFNQTHVTNGLTKSKSIAAFIFYFGKSEAEIELSPFGSAWLDLNKQPFLAVKSNTTR